MASLSVVLDTNVLVSAIAYPQSLPGRILAAWKAGSVEVVLSQYILDELVRVLPRLKKISLTAGEIRTLADSLMFQAQYAEPGGAVDGELRDTKDQPVLQTLLVSGAQYLISGDKDLLALAARYPVLSPADFCARHGL